MTQLIIAKKNGLTFEKSKIVSAILTLDGVCNCKEGSFIGSIFECEYHKENDFIVIRLSDDLTNIVLNNVSDLSLLFSLQISNLISDSLEIFDTDYSFHLCLDDIGSLGEFKEKIWNSQYK